MLLKDKYFKVIKETKLDNINAVYLLSILPNSDVYRGHFPQKPVCPGVCNIEAIRECAELFSGRDLAIKTINRCRLTAVATPLVCPLVDVQLTLTPTNEEKTQFTLIARLYSDDTTYMEMKAELEAKAARC